MQKSEQISKTIVAVGQEPLAKDSRASRTAASGFSPLWLLNMLITYASATALLHQLLGAPSLTEQWRMQLQVPQMYHVISSVTFGTAFCLDLLAAAFYLESSRLELTLLPAWIKGMPFVSSLLMAMGKNVLAVSASGKIVNLQRYICWMHSTPAVMYLIKTTSTNITTKQMLSIIVLHEVQLGLGAVAKLSSGYVEMILGAAVHIALVPVLMFLHKGLRNVGSYHGKAMSRFVYVFTLVTYCSFGVAWDLDAFGLTTPAQEEALYLFAEFASKMLFSTILMFSGFRNSEMVRIGVMRSIEESSKQQLIQELQSLVEQKDQFMSSVSHELRTPLNGIIGLSEAALMNSEAAQSNSPPAAAAAASALVQLHPTTKNQFQLIKSSGLRLLHLVNDILDTTALEHNRLVLDKQRVMLRPLCEEVADITRATLKAGVVLHCRVPPDLEVVGDQERIVQVLNNLVRNAVKFTPSGSITLSAQHGIQNMPQQAGSSEQQQQQHREVVMISVSDTGYGIPANKLRSIFLPFEQVHVQESRSQRGLGLGLSIVHKLVTAMDGTISVASEVGKGSTFTVSLPAYAAAADARQTAITAAAAVADESARQQATGLTPLLLYSSSSSNRRDAIMSPVQMEPKTPSAVSGGRSGTAAAAAAMADNQTARHPLRSGSSGSSSFNASAFANHPDAFAGIEVKAFRSADPAAAAAAAGSSHTRQQQQQAHTESSADLSDSDDWPTAKAPGSGSDFDKTAAAAAAAADAGSSSGGGGDQQAAYGDAITAECFYSEVNEGRIQLLVVDDDQANHEVMSLLLESAGYTLVHTYSGQETLKYLTKCQVLPDVVLLDAAMPGFDGREVCWRIRSMMAKSPLYLPIVMVTAQVSAYAVDASVAAGADDHLGKPFGRNDLLKCVRDNYKKQKRSI